MLFDEFCAWCAVSAAIWKAATSAPADNGATCRRGTTTRTRRSRRSSLRLRLPRHRLWPCRLLAKSRRGGRQRRRRRRQSQRRLSRKWRRRSECSKSSTVS